MSSTEDIWRVKVAAWIHDPIEKALVLLRDPLGHEGGTVREIRTALFGATAAPPPSIEACVKRADRWASAADRPQFPQVGERGGNAGLRVSFAKAPVLIHPLSGETLELTCNLEQITPEPIKAAARARLLACVCRDGAGSVDWKRTFLTMWRLLKEMPPAQLDSIWGELPADTRVPDHTIWDHLRLTSAFAGAMAVGDPALLSVTLGPVQNFIARSRRTSDLWAGSHLLARLSWEAMRVVSEALGPDSVLFPELHGVPLADSWLEQQGVRFDALARKPDWRTTHSAANPLFSATLPNRFVALVPEPWVRELARLIEDGVRKYVRTQAEGCLELVLAQGGAQGDRRIAEAQLAQQLDGFPEIHWAAVRWPETDGTHVDQGFLGALATHYPERANTSPGFFASRAWTILGGGEQVCEGVRFFAPNPGAVYPAVYELLERQVAPAKTVRRFHQTAQRGYRCTLCGEREWLTLDRRLLDVPKGQRGGEGDLWARVSATRPAWARPGEYLCAICATKRVWPQRFEDEIGRVHGVNASQHTISTHTMALARTIELLAQRGCDLADGAAGFKELEALLERVKLGGRRAALPRSLHELIQASGQRLDFLRKLPIVWDELRERRDAAEGSDRERSGARDTLEELRLILKNLTGTEPERYYALILLDGDRLGAWLSGDAELESARYRDAWHPSVRAEAERIAREHATIGEYLDLRRAPSPGHHAAISRALNGFAVELAQHVVESLFKGKLIYAGGDDLLAMVSVDDLLGVMLGLRCVYTGLVPSGGTCDAFWKRLGANGAIELRRGFARMKGGRPLRLTMGPTATASLGAVIAHHSSPLSGVLRQLHAAEKRAKEEGGRDAFCITLCKRAGGQTNLVCNWLLRAAGQGEGGVEARELAETAIGTLLDYRDAFANVLARRAAYHLLSWLPGIPSMPSPELEHMLEGCVAKQLERQRRGGAELGDLAARGVRLAAETAPEDITGQLERIITVTEFLAREGRAGVEAA